MITIYVYLHKFAFLMVTKNWLIYSQSSLLNLQGSGVDNRMDNISFCVLPRACTFERA